MKDLKRIVVLLAVGIFLIVISFTVVLRRGAVYNMDQSSNEKHNQFEEVEETNTTTKVGCHLPQLDPFDTSVMSKIKHMKLKCKKVQPELFNLRNGTLTLNKTELGKNTDISCYYRCVLFDERYENVSYGASTNISLDAESKMVLCETIYILCQEANGSSVYENRLTQILPKKTITGRKVWTEKPNVVLLFVDSVSRSQFIRSLPKTRKFLLENLGALEFTGLVTVGYNTYPNIFPAISGRSAPPAYVKQNKTFDDWPFIWYNYSKEGYATLHADEMPEFSIYYDYGGIGFTKRPFDHFYRANLRGIRSFRHFVANYWTKCFGNRAKHEVALEYLMQLFEAYPSTPTFSYVHIIRLTHDSPNYLSAADDTFLQFLKRFEGFLNNTFFFFLSDHGSHYGPIPGTTVGALETKLPFFTLRVPIWFSEKYPGLMRILAKNSKGRLISFYDIHATLEFIQTQSWKRLPIQRSNSKGPTHLFNTISISRTCPDAKIPLKQCVCYQSVAISVNDSTVLAGSRFIVNYINRLLIPYKNRCHQLTLDKVLKANVYELPVNRTPPDAKAHEKDVPTMLLTIQLRVKPSSALLQALITYQKNTVAFSLQDRPDRINRYHEQSTCLGNDKKNRPYCYCKKH